MVGRPPIDPARPLIICDADEVILQFMAGLEDLLASRGLYHDFSSFRIHGNVRVRATGEPVPDTDVSGLFRDFFATRTRHVAPVPGAADALARLARHAQVIVLSNVPEDAREARAENLAQHGMPYPVIAGAGPKGPIVRRLVEGVTRPVVFIDDLPPHHTSVAQEAPAVHRLHFVADPRLARLLPPSPDAHSRIDDWATAEPWIAARLAM